MKHLFGVLMLAATVLGAPAPAFAVQVIEARTWTFDSGLRVVLARTPPRGEPGRVHVSSYVDYGSRDEANPGEAHFIEHIAANSRALTSPPAPSPHAVGYESNAVTRGDHTSFIRAVSPDAIELAIFGRLSRLGRFVRDDAILERERSRVLAELERGRLAPGYSAYKALEALSRGAPPQLVSETDHVTGVSGDQLWEIISRRYGPAGGALIVAGDIDLIEVEAMVRQWAASLDLDQTAASARPDARSAMPHGGHSAMIAQNAPGVFSAAVGFPPADPASDAHLAFMVLDQLLMGGRTVEDGEPQPQRAESSPLAARLGARIGATSVYDGKDTGWGVPSLAEGVPSLYAITFQIPQPYTPDDVRRQVLGALADIRRSAMSDQDVVDARNRLADFYDAWLRTPDGRVLADHLASLPPGSAPESLNSLVDRIRAVTPDDARSQMDRLLARTDAAVVVLTPRAD